jgi:6-bladed beta-propeller
VSFRRPKAILFFALVAISLFGCQRHRGKTLPVLEGLKELALLQVADATAVAEIASAGFPLVSSEDQVFFFDPRLNQLFKSRLDGRGIVPVGRSGEGPGEYTRVLGLLLEDDNLYVLDARRKIICLDYVGDLVWEDKVPSDLAGLIGKRGDVFYFSERRMDGSGRFMLGLREWSRAKEARLLFERPIVTAQGYARYQGKLIKGGGIFFLAEPAFALIGDALAVAASDRYEFELLDLDGNARQKRVFEAPEPDQAASAKAFESSESVKNYAIARIIPWREGFWAISNYHLNGKPRIDRFSAAGELVSSHLLPLEFNPPSRDIVIQGEYVFFIDRDETGFRVFRFDDQDR